MSLRASRDNRMKSGWNATGLLYSALIPNNAEMAIAVVVIFLNDTFNFIRRKTQVPRVLDGDILQRPHKKWFSSMERFFTHRLVIRKAFSSKAHYPRNTHTL